MKFSPNEWSTLTKTALKAWHRPIELEDHPLAQLAIVQNAIGTANIGLEQAQALRDLFKKGIDATRPPDELHPTTDDAPQWFDPAWRTWSLLTLLYVRRLSRGEVQARIGMAEGGQYYTEQRRAIGALARILQKWEADADRPKQNLILTWPGGAVRLDDPLYVERESDAELARILQRPGQTVTIRGARQVGKTSLLVRGVETAVKKANCRLAYIDLQSMGQADFESYDSFLSLIAEWLLDELDLDIDLAEKAWQSRLGAARKLTKLIERVVLPAADTPLVIALDEVDRLIMTPFADDFFGLLRSWHNLRSRSPLWERLTILMAISTEPYLLIQDMQQSPFNVGQTLHLQDFDLGQIKTLNQQHGAPLSTADCETLLNWTGGQPFLTRLALYAVVERQQTLADVIVSATKPDSPFAGHLSHLWRLLNNDPALLNVMQSILSDETTEDSEAEFRLLKSGLIRSTPTGFVCRCELYRDYLGGRL